MRRYGTYCSFPTVFVAQKRAGPEAFMMKELWGTEAKKSFFMTQCGKKRKRVSAYLVLRLYIEVK